MKPQTTSFTKRALLGAAIVGTAILGASAYAVAPERTADTPRCEARHAGKAGDAAQARAARLASLKEKLKLSAAQEPAWGAFVNAAGPRHQRRGGEGMRGEGAKLSAPERLDRMLAKSEMRHARMAERAAALKTFYAQLSVEQQQVFDAEAGSGRHRRGHHARHSRQS